MAKKTSSKSANIPLIIIILIIVLGLAFAYSAGHREGQRETNVIPKPNVKPVPEVSVQTTDSPKVTEPRVSGQKAAKTEETKRVGDDAPKAAEAQKAESANKTAPKPKGESAKKGPSKQEMIDMLNRFDRKANEEAQKAGAAADNSDQTPAPEAAAVPEEPAQ